MKLTTEHIFTIHSEEEFFKIALEIFRFQAKYNSVYKSYIKYLGKAIKNINTIEKIPFLPISFFKTQKIICHKNAVHNYFQSSGTTTQNKRSKHYVTDIKLYEKSFLKTFRKFYGNENEYIFLALLPDYQKNKHSSLIYMVDTLIRNSNSKQSRYYLHDKETIIKDLKELDEKEKKVFLISVGYALLDLIEQHTFNLKNTIILETGGMKGKRPEMIKEQFHTILKQGFGVDEIHSEYGMTELLSQAYSLKDGIFKTPPWMKVMIRDIYDPFQFICDSFQGGINIIDLANIWSCSFIATDDIGVRIKNNEFYVKGRIDNKEIRGCNLLLND